jgi:hypothetical protein
MLTSAKDEERRPEFEEGRTGGWSWWPARCPADWGAPADLRRQEAAQHARLGVLELVAGSAAPVGYLVRRDGAAEPGSYRDGGVLQRGGARQGGARRGWSFKGARQGEVVPGLDGRRRGDAGLRRESRRRPALVGARWALSGL